MKSNSPCPKFRVLSATAMALLFASTAAAETEDVPCDDNARGDIWTATIPAGANVQVGVDTLSAATTFDPAMDIIPANGPPWVVRSSEALGGGDDEFNCAFEPQGNVGCPFDSGQWEGEVAFLVFNLGNCAGTIGEYEITLTVDAAPAALTLTEDDIVVDFAFDGDPPGPEPGPAPTPDPTPAPTPDPNPSPDPQPAANPEPANDPEPGDQPALTCACAANSSSSLPFSAAIAALFGVFGLVSSKRRGRRVQR